MRGIDPSQGMVLVEPRPGELTLRTEDIIRCIREHGQSLALVFLPGVQYYSGQLFDLQEITRAAHKVVLWVSFSFPRTC